MDEYAVKLNNRLLKEGATDDEATRVMLQSSEKVRDAFRRLDPYVQAILIQSVFRLSPSEFGRIEPSYREIIDIAMKSNDEWVKRKAQEFQNFPKITPLNDGAIDFSVIGDPNPNAIRTIHRTQSKSREQRPFKLKKEVDPPSKSLGPPVLQEPVRHEQKTTQQPSLAISREPRPMPRAEPRAHPRNLLNADLTEAQQKREKSKPQKVISLDDF